MPTIIKHRKVKILVLATDESIPDNCRPGDIAIIQDDEGWWTKFIGENGTVDSYDIPFESCHLALCAAKAAAEFGF